MRKRLEKNTRSGVDIEIEKLKQDIKATTLKIKRFTKRNKQYRENRML